MAMFGTDMGCVTIAVGFLMVLFHHVGSTDDQSVDLHCESFNCSNFSNQTLVIKKDLTDNPLCIIHKNTPIGEDVPCGSTAVAVLLSPSYLLVQSLGRRSSRLLLEYGRDHERGKTCYSEEDDCPTPPPAMTSNDTSRGHFISLVLGIGTILLVLLVVLVAVLIWVGRSRYLLVPKTEQPPVPPGDATTSV